MTILVGAATARVDESLNFLAGPASIVSSDAFFQLIFNRIATAMAFNREMHPRNPFKENPPDFKQLSRRYPEFRKHCSIEIGGKITFDFANTDAVRLLSRVLLLDYFQLDVDLPEGALVPRIPQRLNYILLVEDLLKANGLATAWAGTTIVGIDIGVGPSCIYPLLGAKLNGWQFYASDIDVAVVRQAKENARKNSLTEKIHLVRSRLVSDVFKSIMETAGRDVQFAFCMCNPPFFDPDECNEKFPIRQDSVAAVLNRLNSARSATEAHPREVSTEGGEVDFVRNIVLESELFKDRVRIFTTMIGRKASWQPVSKMLKDLSTDVKQSQLYSLSQGRTQRWVVAWTFDPSISLPAPKDVGKG